MLQKIYAAALVLYNRKALRAFLLYKNPPEDRTAAYNENVAGATAAGEEFRKRNSLFCQELERSKKMYKKDFNRINRELKYHGAILDVYQDTVTIPNGNTAKWDFIKHKGAAAVIPITDDGRIIMVRQYRNALERDTLEIPAGGLDSVDEPGIQCAARELEEETGYHSDDLEWLITIRTTVAFCNEKIDIFTAKNLRKTKQHLDEDEFIDLELYTLEELQEKILTGEIEDSKTVAALMSYQVKLEKSKA